MARVLALAGLTVLLAGCVSAPIVSPFSSGPVDSRSPVANEVAAAAKAPGPYPKFADIPSPPKDVRPASAWRAAVLTEWDEKRALEREVAALSFTLTNTEDWARTERAKIPESEMKAVEPDAAADSEAFAQAQRERATPPPAPH